MLYQIVVFLHVVFVLGYLLAHGVSAAVAFALKKERDLNRIRALLDLSAASYPAMLGKTPNKTKVVFTAVLKRL